MPSRFASIDKLGALALHQHHLEPLALTIPLINSLCPWATEHDL